MDGLGRREQRGHGGAWAGSQRDNANQPGRHEHHWIPHPLITDPPTSSLSGQGHQDYTLLGEGRSAPDIL